MMQLISRIRALDTMTSAKRFFIVGLISFFVVMVAGTADACRMYGVVSDNLPDGLLEDHLIDAPNSLKNLAISGNVDGWGIASYPYYLVDNGLNDSLDSADLRANGSGQDWYESRNDVPTLLTLNEADVGGNSSKKAALLNYGIASNAYLTQELSSAQTGSFSVSFDIYIDRIQDNASYDRSGVFYIGDDSVTTNPPNGTSNERFVFMAFYDSTPGDTGNDIQIRCRTSSSQTYATSSAWTQVATGLSYDNWHTIRLTLDVAAGTYDVYVDDVLRGDNVAKYNGFVSASLTHLSFVSDSDGRGDFYVDNVRDTIERGAERAYTDASYDTVVGYLNAHEPKVTVAHVRNCVTGCCEHNLETIADPHPFYRYKNGKRWTFVHNGTVSIPLLESLIGPVYLSANPPNGSDIQNCITDVVDSELYFLYVLKEIEEAGWNATNGIVAAVNELIDNGEGGMNFILSDGDTIWGFRRQDSSSHTLYYLDGSLDGYSAVASQYPSSTQGSWQVINNDELVVLTAGAAPVVIDIYNAGCVTDADCNDGVACTVDTCEPNSTCLNTPDNSLCDDGLFCNGAETCNATSGCLAGTDPCPGQLCDEVSDICIGLSISADFESSSIGSYSIDGNVIDLTFTSEYLSNTGDYYTYWSNFKVSNTAGRQVTFNITNADDVPFLADTSHEREMIYSCDDGANWSRITDYSYAGTTYTFTETFAESCTDAQIATFFPFSYTEMQAYVSSVEASPWVTSAVLGTSELGRNIDRLTITNPAIPTDDKTVIYITGRVHAGETGSSHMLEGMIDFLISDNPDAARMRDNLVFYIVPMVNPDGVYLGKSRATSEERDPNRDWHPDNHESVEIDIVRADLIDKNNTDGIDMFIDWHTQMNDISWYNFTYAPPGNTFFPILSSWTDFDNQDTSGTSCSPTSCAARGYATLQLGVLMFGFEPTPHLISWTDDSLRQEGVNVAYALDEYFVVPAPPTQILVDSLFDDSATSVELRANAAGQDWYESRGGFSGGNPALLTLDTTLVGGNSGKKAALKSYDVASNAYLTQEFSAAQSGTFEVSFDINIDRIFDEAADRTAAIYIGNDSSSINCPTGTSNERFVFLSFYDSTPATDGDLEIRAREYNAPVQPYAETNTWTPAASGLSYDTWYTIKVEVNVAAGTYNVYVDGVLTGANINKYEGYASSSVGYLSFAVFNTDGRGDFYVDNVYSPPPEEPECESAADCDDSNVCTDDDCVAGSCEYTNNAAPCDDGNACTENDICSAGSCQAGSPLDCSDSNPCTDDSCDPASGCVHTDNTAPCDDGLFCTATDICADGICLGSGDPCTPPLICDEAADACLGCVNDADCNDGNVCTDDTCAAGTCVNDNNSDPCDDGSACTENDTCTAGSCQGTAVDCNDSNVCTDDSCNPASGCEYVNNTAPCDDGLFCNGSDTCAGGSCSAHAGDPCTPPQVCDEGSGACIDQGTDLLTDIEFEDSTDSADLRANSAGQDWYESRNDVPTLLTLNEALVGGNGTKKAALLNYGTASNAYLTQEFTSVQDGTFTVSFDMYIDRIQDNGTYDRSGIIYIGDNRVTTNPPTGTSDERFVFMAFYDSTPGDAGNDLELRARTSSAQAYGTTSAWTQVATGLSYDTWHTVKILLDVAAGTYDVYVNDVLEGLAIPKYSGYTASSVSFITFSSDSDGRGDFYVDNAEALSSSLTADFSADVTSGDAPLSVQFTDLSTGAIDTWSWDFNNDGTEDSSDQNPAYIYTLPGSYTVSLVVSGAGGTDTETRISYISVTGGAEPALHVTPTLLDFGAALDTLTLQIMNRGNEPFDWEAASGEAWITAIDPDQSGTPLQPGESVTVSVTINRDSFGLLGGSEHNCRMWGAISDTTVPGSAITYDLITAPVSLKSLTSASSNNDGWSVAYYLDFGDDPVIQRGAEYASHSTAYDNAVNAMASLPSKKITLGHVRNCTSGCCDNGNETINDPHPFYRVKNGTTWLFQHNGDINKTVLTNAIGAEYLAANPPTGSAIPQCDPSDPNLVVDSELYFLLLLKNIEANNWSVEQGILDTFPSIQSYAANFIMSDGYTMWALRRGHDLAYFYDQASGYAAVASQPSDTSDDRWTVLADNTLVVLRPGEAPQVIPVADFSTFETGTIHITTSLGEMVDVLVTAQELPAEPTFISFVPESGTSTVGTARTFSLELGDGDGYEDLSSVRFVIKEGAGTGTTSDAIILEYRSSAPTRIYMYNQATSGWIYAVMGSATILENALCSIDASQTGVSGNGNMLTLDLNITPKAAFIAAPISEQKRIWLRAKDTANNTLGDLEIGAWSVVESFECDDNADCDDGIACTVDTCTIDSTCLNTPDNAFCDDGLFCNGTETCNLVSGCLAGSDPCPGRLCDEANNTCVDCLTDADCDDGAFCNGEETCSGGTCIAGTGPCVPPLLCNETMDICGECITDMDCDDGNECTDDTCGASSACLYSYNTNPCNDGIFCNGSDTCSDGSCSGHAGDPCTPPLSCDEGSDTCLGCITDEDCDDGVACTVDTCELNGTCLNTPDNALCDDGLFCNGAETCNAVSGCLAGTDPCPGQPCDEALDQCTGTFPPEPTFVSFTPASGTSVVGVSRNLVLTLADGDGYADLTSIRFVIKQGTGTGTSSDAIILEYRSAAPTRIYLYDQATSRWIYAVMGSATILENGLCAIDASQTSRTGNGAMLTLNLSITPKAAFIAAPLAENKRIWLRVKDVANHTLGDLEIGAWSVVASFECDEDADCNDGIVCTADSCEPDGTCLSTPDNALCDDGAFCNGAETCSPTSGCLAGTNPCPGQLCDEVSDTCADCLTDADCEDGAFCSGDESCAGGSCQPGPDPCPGQLCDEVSDICVDCLTDADCDDGAFCSGIETCVEGTCIPGTNPCVAPLECDEALDTCQGCITDEDCDDGINCTVDTCETDATCLNTPDTSLCDDGLFCNGAETCDALTGCLTGADPCPGQLCDEVSDICADCLTNADCDDGAFCNGAEICAGGSCQAGSDPCSGQFCDEAGNTCVDCLTNADCDDGAFCNGAEICAGGSCQPGTDPCPGQPCDEDANQCIGTFPPEPTFVSLTPAIETSLVDEPVDFTLAIADGNGYADLSSIRFVIKEGAGTGTTSDALILEYRSAAPTRIYMWHNTQARWIWALMGSSTILENTLCSIDASQTSVSGNGDVLTLNLNIIPKAAFIAAPLSEDKRIWLRVKDVANHTLGDLEIGAWEIIE